LVSEGSLYRRGIYHLDISLSSEIGFGRDNKMNYPEASFGEYDPERYNPP
jgi:hypothetical protein